MADIKISQLPAATTPLAGTEEVPLVQSGVTKKTTVADIVSKVGAVTAVTGTAPVVSSGGATPAISMAAATASANGYLTSTDWNTFNNKQPAITVLPVVNGGNGTATPALVAGANVTITGSWPNQTIATSASAGTVTSASVVSANGLAGTVANPTTTPAITLSTTVTGLVKGNGTALSAATAGTDYVAPGGALGTPSSGTLTNTTGLPLTTGVTGLLPVANGGTGTATPALVAGTNVTITGSWPNQTINSGGGSGMVYPGAGIPNSTGTAWDTSYSTTGSGSVVLSTSPSLTTPVLGTPTSGDFSTGTFTWPTFNQNTTGTAANITASSNSTVTTLSALSLPGSQVSGNISGNAANVTGTIAIANGGSGTTTAQGAMNAFAGAVTSGSYLRGNGTNVVMAAIQAADVPTLNQNTTGTAANVTGTVAAANGGTGLTAAGTSGNVLTSNGTTWTSSTPAAGVSLSAANTWTATQTFNGSSSTFGTALLDSNEVVNVVAAAPSSTTNFYLQSGSVQYYTSNAANNWTLNIAFSSGTSMNTALATGQSVTFTLVTTQNSTAYYNNAVTIDGTSVTPKWIGGAPTAGNASGLDVYRYAVIKTASATYTVLASLTQYK